MSFLSATEFEEDFEKLRKKIANLITKFEEDHGNMCIVSAYIQMESQKIWQYNGESFDDNQELDIVVKQ